MAGTRLRCVLHDGNKVRDNRAVSTKFKGTKVLDFTKSIYNTESKHYAGLGEEITSINGIKKQGDDGFQVYLAIMKDGEVLEMGLPHVKDSSGEEKFLNAANLKISDLESVFGHMPEDVEVAIVWRLDKGMTQDIVLTENSMISQMAPNEPADGFSLLDEKPPVGCGGGFDKDIETTYDLTQVFIYTGEQDDPIRMSSMIVEPEVSSWDGFDHFAYQDLQPTNFDAVPQQKPDPQLLQIRKKITENHIPKFNIAFSTEEDQAPTQITFAPIDIYHEFHTSKDAQSPEQKTEETKPIIVALFICSDAPRPKEPKPFDFRPEKNKIIELIMNPTERKLWGKLYGFPEEEPPMLLSPKTVVQKPAVKRQLLTLQKLPTQKLKLQQLRMPKLTTPKIIEAKPAAPQLKSSVPQLIVSKPAPTVGSQRSVIEPQVFQQSSKTIHKEKSRKVQKTVKKQKTAPKPKVTTKKKQTRPKTNPPKQMKLPKQKPLTETKQKPQKKRKTPTKKQPKPEVTKTKKTKKPKPKTSLIVKTPKKKTRKKRKTPAYFMNQLLGLYKESRKVSGKAKARSSL